MRTFTIATLAVALLGVNGLPSLVKRANNQTIDDTTVLNFALTLEFLESAFYSSGLAQFDQAAFEKAGFAPFVRGRFVQIGDHEKQHVSFLSAALGANATKPCNYSFPYTDPVSFAALSQVLEGVGVSAYTGAAQYISNKNYLTAAASVLATEARHASWVAAAVNKGSGWSGAFDVPLGLNEVYTLAAAFITSCPSTNPTLPVKAFPALTFNATSLNQGSSVAVEYPNPSANGTFIAIFTGLEQVFAPITNGQFVIPAGLAGTSYAVVTSSNETANDDTILAGPGILDFSFNSTGSTV